MKMKGKCLCIHLFGVLTALVETQKSPADNMGGLFAAKKYASVKDYEIEAKAVMPPIAWEYVMKHDGQGITYHDNIAAFDRYRLLPLVLSGLQDMTEADLGLEVFGKHVTMPIGLCPAAIQRLAHPKGELASARAMQAMGGVVITSITSTYRIEDVAKAAPKANRWQQMYLFDDMRVISDIVRRCEENGVHALVVTVDRPLNTRSGRPSSFTLPNFRGYGSVSWGLQNFEKLIWLRNQTKLPLVVKGILTGNAARQVVQAGADAVIVSNHGGRVLDGGRATIDSLSEVVQALKGTGADVFLDGGVRSGRSAFKARALGAKMVFVGRPQFWGLAVGGEQGVYSVLEILRDEYLETTKLMGVRNDTFLSPDLVTRNNYFQQITGKLLY